MLLNLSRREGLAGLSRLRPMMRSYPTPTSTNFCRTMRRWLASRMLRRDLSDDTSPLLMPRIYDGSPVFKITLVIVERKGKTLFTYLTEVFTLKYRILVLLGHSTRLSSDSTLKVSVTTIRWAV